MQFEAVLKNRKTFGPFSRVLVVAEDLFEAKEFAEEIYKEDFIEIKELN